LDLFHEVQNAWWFSLLNHPHFPNKYDGFVASIDLEHCALLSVMKLVNEKKKAVPGMRLNCIAVKETGRLKSVAVPWCERQKTRRQDTKDTETPCRLVLGTS
jgi:hypothetical protein